MPMDHDDQDKALFLELLAQEHPRFGWVCDAFQGRFKAILLEADRSARMHNDAIGSLPKKGNAVLWNHNRFPIYLSQRQISVTLNLIWERFLRNSRLSLQLGA